MSVRHMNYLIKLPCAALFVALDVKADSMSQSNGEPTASHNLTAMAGFSSWKFVPLERAAGIMWRHLQSNDFQDTRFEYRWKSDWSVSGYVCTVEIRNTDEAAQSLTVPEINVGYSGPSRIGLHFRLYTAHDVTRGPVRMMELR